MPERKKLRHFHVPGPGVDTCRIVPCCALPQSCPIVAYRGIASHFYAPIGAGHKVFCPLMSKLLWSKDFVTLVSYVIGNTICIAETYLRHHIMRKVT